MQHGFIMSNFPVFLFGAILAKYMDKSGATVTIADKIMKLVGVSSPYRALLAVFVISAFLTLGGINVFVVIFILIPMAKPIFKQVNIPWKLVTIPIWGGATTFTMTMIPGSPSLHNIVPSNALGTPLTAAPLVGIVTTIVSILFLLAYMKHTLNKNLKNNEVFNVDVEPESSVDLLDRERPSFVMSILPLIALLGIILVFSSVNKIIIIALIVSVVMSAVLFRKYLPKQKDILNQGANDSLLPTFSTGSTIAFGTMAVGVPAFSSVFNAILSIPGNPLISLMLGTGLLSAISGSAVGAAGISVANFAPAYLKMGLSPEIIHRAIAISCSALACLPHTGFYIVFNSLAGFTMKDSFKYAFISLCVTTWIAMVVVVIMAYLGIA